MLIHSLSCNETSEVMDLNPRRIRLVGKYECHLSFKSGVSSLRSSRVTVSKRVGVSPFIFSLSVVSGYSGYSIMSTIVFSMFVFGATTHFNKYSFELFGGPSVYSFIPYTWVSA